MWRPEQTLRVRRVTAVEPLVEACALVWVAHSSENADTASAGDRSGLDVPPANPQGCLRPAQPGGGSPSGLCLLTILK